LAQRPSTFLAGVYRKLSNKHSDLYFFRREAKIVTTINYFWEKNKQKVFRIA
jgi:hypothetical protein